jgi:ABC-type multidrug transport system fused ATPase/permease subunit
VGNIGAARKLHLGIVDNIIHSPMSFFDTTPQGRILNRFGKDIDTIDAVLPQNVSGWISCMLSVLAVPIVIGMSTPLFLVTLIPLVIFYVFVQVGR